MENFKLFLKIDEKDYEDPKSHNELKRPEIIDIMASDGVKFKTATNLLYFKKPERYPLDLNKGFENFKFRYQSYHNAGISKIEEHLIKKDASLCEADEMTKIYASRSVIYKMMIFPYPHRFDDEEIIYATKFDDVIYLCNAPDSKSAHRQTRNDTHHFKFKQYCFSDSPKSRPRTDVPIDENKQNYCVYRSQIGNFDIVYSAELTGIQSDEEISDPTNLEELNQCRFVMTKLLRQKHSWQKNEKILNFWAQSYLANISDVYVGFKERGGIVLAPVQHAFVEDLPKNQNWKPKVCIGFLHEFLKKIEEKMSEVNCPYTVYEFRSKTSQKCINYKIHEGKTAKTFLSEKFIKQMLKK